MLAMNLTENLADPQRSALALVLAALFLHSMRPPEGEELQMVLGGSL